MPPNMLGLKNPGPGRGSEPDAPVVSMTASWLMRGRLRRAAPGVSRLGQHLSGQPATQRECRSENPAHHPNTNGPGRRSPAMTSRRPAAVPQTMIGHRRCSPHSRLTCGHLRLETIQGLRSYTTIRRRMCHLHKTGLFLIYEEWS